MSQLININNIQGNFYGGLPYNINWSFNGGESPSKLTVSVVNEKGSYPTPRMSLSNLQTIRFGEFSFNGYLIGYNYNNSASQKTLDLEYVDKSIDLNKYYVALNYKQVPISYSNPNVIKVGKQYHPCDTNLDSTISYKEANSRNIDPCDPCPFMPEHKHDYICDSVRSNFEIFEVYYTFNELIDKISKFFRISFSGISRYNNYKAQYFGLLPSVLSSWCSDLGLSYHWDPFTNGLIFLDRSKRIEIPKIPNDQKIIEVNYGSSLENTFSRGFMGVFEKAGEIKNYQCEKEQFVNLKCLTVDDLYEKRDDKKENQKIEREADIKELSSVVSYLGPDARKVFLWFWYYNVDTAASLYNKYLFKEETSSKKGKDEDTGKVVMPHFGDMKILDVWWNGGNQSQVRAFQRCRKELSEADLKFLEEQDKKHGRDTTNPSYYFFIAESNEELADKLSDNDVNMAKSFLGRFWFKKFIVPIPGATNDNGQVSAESPDGSVGWYQAGEEVKGLPIFDFGHEEGSRIGKLIKQIAADVKKNEEEQDKAREAAQNFVLEKEKTLRSTISYLLLDRQTKWWPNEDYLKWYDSTLKWYADISPQIFGNDNGRPDFLNKIYPDAKKNSNIKLFIARELYEPFTVEFKKEKHPLEIQKNKYKTEDIQDVFGKTQKINKGKYGLNNSKCVRISMPGIEFFTPAQCFGNNKLVDENPPAENAFDTETDYGTDDGDAGYRVYTKSNADFTKVLPKIQYHYIINPSSKEVAQYDFQVKQITEDNLKIMRSQDGQQKCLVDRKLFENYTKKVAEFSSYTQNQQQDKMNFKIAGIAPLMYRTTQGLSSLSIVLSDDGAYTTYSLEDKIIQPPSDSYVDQYLKDYLIPKSSLGGSQPISESQRDQMKRFSNI